MDILIKALSKRKLSLAQCILDALNEQAQFVGDREALGAARYILTEFRPLADYLINFLRTDETVWRDLYLAHVLLMLQWPSDDKQAELVRREAVLDQIRKNLVRLALSCAEARSVEALDKRLLALNKVVARENSERTEVRVLFVGDCMMLSIIMFLIIPLIALGIELRAQFASSRNLASLKKQMLKHVGHIDLICYSPYSVSFNPVLFETWHNPNVLQSRRKLQELSNRAHLQTQSTLQMLIELSDCNIYVQNTLNNSLLNGSITSIAKWWITYRQRKLAAGFVNDLLSRAVSEMNQGVHRPLVMVDEAGLSKEFSGLALGKHYYEQSIYHPTVLAERLSQEYCDLIVACKLLSTKKVVVLDLDETLWDGTIGEGAVQHYAERQRKLIELKRKGILLAIASMNDPQNVHWTGGVLSAEDFAAQQIGWTPKAVSIRRISSELNLNLKDFVFIDDRADQREMVKASVPEVQVLDAAANSTWEMLHWWALSLPEQSGHDRTQLYAERKQRETFLSNASDNFDQDTIFGALGLKVEFYVPGRKELRRVAELINRTNQFNTCASRTSVEQIAAQNESHEYQIIVANAKDKFGEMGIVSAMILNLTDDSLSIRTWVLSCRVFGYGIETAMLNYVRRIGQGLQIASLQGQIVETANNQPCRDVYADNGFVQMGAGWTTETSAISKDSSWLEVCSS